MKKVLLFFNVTGALLLSLVLFPIIVVASTSSGTIDHTYKYAWSDNIGWINFAPTFDGSGTYAGLVITDSQVTGYAWSQNYGWINFHPTNCTDCGVTNNGQGILSGKAWGQNTGWIDFNGVTIDTSTGQLKGTASGSVNGNNIAGTINFNLTKCTNCGVKTDWRPASATSTSNQSGSKAAEGPDPSPIPPPFAVKTIQQKFLSIFKAKPNIKDTYYWLPKFIAFNFSPTKLLKAMQTELIRANAVIRTFLQTFIRKPTTQEHILWSKIFTSLKFSQTKLMNAMKGKKVTTKPASSPIITVTPAPQSIMPLFTRDLKPGDTSLPDIKTLQQYLNTHGFQIASKGPGSPSKETTIFDPLTRQALKRFQEAHADQILKPIGLTKGTGYFGPSTRDFINSLSGR
jgi:hypothetical protein